MGKTDRDRMIEDRLQAWPFRVWQGVHAVSAVAFLVFLYFTGPSWAGVCMAFIAGVNISQARFYGYCVAINAVQLGVHMELKRLRDDYTLVPRDKATDTKYPSE